MLMLRLKSVMWWFWLLTAILIGVGLAGHIEGFVLAMAFAAFQIVFFTITERDLKAFPVQVRVAYTLLLYLLFWEPLRWLYWAPFLGTLARVLVGYCPMARFLSLMPWNRTQPLSLQLVRKTFLSPPVDGSILKQQPKL